MGWDLEHILYDDIYKHACIIQKKRLDRLCRIASTVVCGCLLSALLAYLGVMQALPRSIKHLELSEERDAIPVSVVKKVTSLYGDGAWMKSTTAANVTYARMQRAVEGHYQHARKHGHEQVVLTEPLFGSRINNEYSKIGILLQENLMALKDRRKESTSQWLFWHDADTIILNNMVSLDVFVHDALDGVNLLYTKDFNGLNGGVFFLRVCEWSTLLLSNILAIAQPDGQELWDFWEQGALVETLKLDYFSKAAVELPKDWINRYPYLEWNNTASTFDNHVKPGTFLVHLAGPDKFEPGWFDYFLDVASSTNLAFHNQSEATALSVMIKEFWNKLKQVP